MNKYIERVIEATKAKNSHEPEFLQTVEEVLTSLEPVINAHPEYEKACLLERMVEPERAIEFRVTWEDDNHEWHVNRRPPSVPSRAVCASIPPSTCPSSSSWASSRSLRMP